MLLIHKCIVYISLYSKEIEHFKLLLNISKLFRILSNTIILFYKKINVKHALKKFIYYFKIFNLKRFMY